MPQLETEAVEQTEAFGVGPILFDYSATFPRDDMNPDTIRFYVSSALEVLEDAVEAAEVAVDWESVQIGFSFPRVADREDFAMIRASVKRLAS